MAVVVSIVLLGAVALALLAKLAHRQHARAGAPAPVVAEPIEDLTAEAQAVGAAAQQALREADETRRLLDHAVTEVAAEVLAEEQRVASAQLHAARRKVSGGLPGLFAP